MGPATITDRLARLFPSRKPIAAAFDYGQATKVSFVTVHGNRQAIATLAPPDSAGLSDVMARALLRSAYPQGWAQP